MKTKHNYLHGSTLSLHPQVKMKKNFHYCEKDIRTLEVLKFQTLNLYLKRDLVF